MTVFLHGLGHFHPDNEITNQFLEDLDIGTDDQWIMERVGIRSRRTALSLDYIAETRNRDPRAAIEAAEYSNAELGAPALDNDIWLYGGDKASIVKIVAESRGGVMPAWGRILDAVTIKKLAIYIHSLGGGA